MTGNVFRVNKTRDYTVMSNHHLRNRNLSLKAKGLLSLMLSLPDEWDYSVAGLVSIVPDGEAAVKSALREIENNGYLRRNRLRGEHGRMGSIVYEIHEAPLFSPEVDFPPVEKPLVENPPQINTNRLNTNSIHTTPIQDSKKELVSTPTRVCGEKTRTKKPKAIPPSVEEVEAYCNERGNGINAQYFCDYYATRDWKLKTGPMKDWKAAVRTWEHNGIDTGRTAPQHRKGGNDELLELIQSGYFDESAEEIAVARAMEEDTARRMAEAAAYMGKG